MGQNSSSSSTNYIRSSSTECILQSDNNNRHPIYSRTSSFSQTISRSFSFCFKNVSSQPASLIYDDDDNDDDDYGSGGCGYASHQYGDDDNDKNHLSYNYVRHSNIIVPPQMSPDHEMPTQTAAIRPLSTGSVNVSIPDHLINGIPDLPKDIKEIHNKLHELKYLLSQTNSISYGHAECNTSSNPYYILRHTSSQTDKTDSPEDVTSEAAHYKDTFISYQQEQLRFLRNENARKTRMLNESTYTNALLRAGKLTDVDLRSIADMLPTLQSIQHKQTISNKESEQIAQLRILLTDIICHGDKSNSVAVVSPSNYSSSSSPATTAVCATVTSDSLGGGLESAINNSHTPTKYTIQPNNASSISNETKMIYSINNYKERFLVTIPSKPTEITLSTVKKYVRHMVFKTTTTTNTSSWQHYRFLFKSNSISKDSKIELLDDQEIVPLLGDKISVTIITNDKDMT